MWHLLASCNLHEGGPNKFVAEAVTRDELLNYCVGRIVVSRFSYDSLVNMGIELFTNGSNGLDAECLEHAIQLLADEIHTTEKMTKLVRLRRLDRRLRVQ